MRPIYTLAIFVSAFLLFLIQPMFSRMALPLLGGAPAVWNTAMVFFQTALLGGYAYAHFLTRRLPARSQWSIHLAVLLVPLLSLPVALAGKGAPLASANPTLWWLRVLTVSVGLPFMVLAATSPLLQKWFSLVSRKHARDPYFLYSASNAGSLCALLSYPIFIEPNLTLGRQSRFYHYGYLLFLGLMAMGMALTWWRARGGSNEPNSNQHPSSDGNTGENGRVPGDARPDWRRRWLWIGWAFVPSSLMLSVTNFITSDIASIPLLWIIPLSLYLFTFMLAFAQRQWLSVKVMIRGLPLLTCPLVLAMAMRTAQPMAILIPLHLVNFFWITWLCHTRLAQDRPHPQYLTQFYFYLSLGGVLGGSFNALLAPLIFSGIAEYPLTLVLGCWLAMRSVRGESADRRFWLDMGLPLGLGFVVLGIITLSRAAVWGVEPLGFLLLFGLPVVFCFLQSQRPLRFSLCLGAVLLASTYYPGARGRVLFQERSFFGVHRVTLDPSGRFRQLLHGHTLHGWQCVDPELSQVPLTYFHPTGPIGQVMEKMDASLRRRTAIIGLGAGSLAAYTQPNDHWTFYEIDPVVEKIARDPRYFTYLSEAAGTVDVQLGDARLTLAQAPLQSYGLIVIDAYSSDAIPLHLITREALRIYLSQLANQGLLAFHISNRNLDLQPVLTALAQDAGLSALVQDEDRITKKESDGGKLDSKWLLMAREFDHFEPLPGDARWHPTEMVPEQPIWTDDYASVLPLLRWR